MNKFTIKLSAVYVLLFQFMGATSRSQELREIGQGCCYFGRATLLSANSAKLYVLQPNGLFEQIVVKDRRLLDALKQKLIIEVFPQMSKVSAVPALKAQVYQLTIALYSDQSGGAAPDERDLAKAYKEDAGDTLLVRIPISTFTTGKPELRTAEIISEIIAVVRTQ